MDTDSFIIHTTTKDIYEDIAEDVEKRFDTSIYQHQVDRSLPRVMNKKVLGLMKNELGGKIMIEFVAPRTKIYSYLMDDHSSEKKAKETKNA